jgi:hypothetical protein
MSDGHGHHAGKTEQLRKAAGIDYGWQQDFSSASRNQVALSLHNTGPVNSDFSLDTNYFTKLGSRMCFK